MPDHQGHAVYHLCYHKFITDIYSKFKMTKYTRFPHSTDLQAAADGTGATGEGGLDMGDGGTEDTAAGAATTGLDTG